MSDRVDEQRREEQRIEAQRLQRSQETKKQSEVKESFAKVVKNIKEARGKESRGEEARQHKDARGQAGLLARRGIENRGLARQVAEAGDRRSFAARRELARAGEERDVKRGILQDETLARTLAKRGEPAGHDGRRGGEATAGEQGGEGRRRAEGDRTAGGQRPDEVLAASGQAATLQAIQGVSPKEASTSGAGLHTDLQQIIDELVEAVHRGVDGNNFGFMHIELKSHILSGSSLSLQSTREGVHLKVHTEDDEVARLLSSGGTAQELGRALDGRGVKLASFEVNATRVLG